MTKLRSVAQVRRLIRSFECGKRHCVGSQASSCRGPWRYADEDDRCCQSVREMSWYVAEKLKLNQIFSGPWNCMGIWGRGDKRDGLGNGFDVELLAQLISPALEALVISFSLLPLVSGQSPTHSPIWIINHPQPHHPQIYRAHKLLFSTTYATYTRFVL